MDMKADIFTITTTMVVEMKENNTIAPYRFKNVSGLILSNTTLQEHLIIV